MSDKAVPPTKKYTLTTTRRRGPAATVRIRKCGLWRWEVLVDEDLLHIPGAHGTYSTIVGGSYKRAERIGRKVSDWLGTLGSDGGKR